MVELQLMNEEDYNDYISDAISTYANEKVQAGTWAQEEAMKNSEDTYSDLLPRGRETDNNYMYRIFNTDTNTKVGYIWFEVSVKPTGREAFIYDIVIFESYRGKGYGTKTMSALDEEVKKYDIDKISLHVFGHNEIAYNLYKKMGYVVTDINMSKEVNR